MIINTALTSSLQIAADKSQAQSGDDITIVPSTIVPTDKILSPHHILLQVTQGRANTSFVCSFEKLRAASTGASQDLLITLPRGLWTINYNLCVKFQSAGTINSTAAVKFLINMENDTQNIAAVFRTTSVLYETHGVVRFLLGADANLRLDIGATGAGDGIDAHICLNGEKNI